MIASIYAVLPCQYEAGDEEQHDQRAEADAGDAGDAAEAAGRIEEVAHGGLGLQCLDAGILP